jgi:hypothetical protein
VLLTLVRLLLVDLLRLALLGRHTKTLVHGLIGRQQGWGGAARKAPAQEPHAWELSKPPLAPLFGAPSTMCPANKTYE